MAKQSKLTVSMSNFPLVTVLTIIFVILKLVGTIDWGWLWVLSPLWIGAAFYIPVFILLVIYYILKDNNE